MNTLKNIFTFHRHIYVLMFTTKGVVVIQGPSILLHKGQTGIVIFLQFEFLLNIRDNVIN